MRVVSWSRSLILWGLVGVLSVVNSQTYTDGCADGTREYFKGNFPNIAGCMGQFRIPGISSSTQPACGRRAGNNATPPAASGVPGEGCTAADLCADGWHICKSAKEVEVMYGGSNPCDLTGTVFYATAQSSAGDGANCYVNSDGLYNDVFGCSQSTSYGFLPRNCSVLNRAISSTQCWDGWDCGTSLGKDLEEAKYVTNVGGNGGVLCCKDTPRCPNCGSGEYCSSAGCADGERDYFTDSTMHQFIAGCSGGWTVPGIRNSSGSTPSAGCGRKAGDLSADPSGIGCSATDLCADGWEICQDDFEVKFTSATRKCEVSSGNSGFYATAARSSGSSCRPSSGSSLQGLLGCGDTAGSANSCEALDKYSGNNCSQVSSWTCSAGSELNSAVHSSASPGGVLCCQKKTTTCASCPVGRYSISPTIACTLCPSGRYTNQTRSTDCVDCPLGSYSSAGLSSCLLCPAGKFANSTKQENCSLCDRNTFSTVIGRENGSCESCTSPYVSAPGASVCVLPPTVNATLILFKGTQRLLTPTVVFKFSQASNCGSGLAFTPTDSRRCVVSELLKPQFLSLFGSNPTCSWTDSEFCSEFEVVSGFNNTVKPGDIVMLGEMLDLVPDTVIISTYSITIRLGGYLGDNLGPQVIIDSPDIIGGCDQTILFDASRTTNLNGRVASYSWHITSATNSSFSLQFFNYTSSLLQVLASDLPTNSNFSVVCTVIDSYGFSGASSKSFRRVSFDANYIPTIQIFEQRTLSHLIYTLKLGTLDSSCSYPENGLLTKFSYYSVQSDLNELVYDQAESVVVLDLSKLIPDYLYSLQMNVKLYDATSDTSLVKELSVSRLFNFSLVPPLCQINGGNLRDVAGLSTLIIDASKSLDPNFDSDLDFGWSISSCSDVTASNNYCLELSNLAGSGNSPLLTIAPSLLNGLYNFTIVAFVTSFSGSLSATCSQTVLVSLNSSNLEVFIDVRSARSFESLLFPSPLSKNVDTFIYNYGDSIRMYGSVKADDSTPLDGVSLSWSCGSVDGLIFVDLRSSTLPGSTNLVIDTKSVVDSAGLSFLVCGLKASYRLSAASSQVYIYINSGPVAGTVSVSPNFGIATKTAFLASAPNWETLLPPLSYSFRLVDVDDSDREVLLTSNEKRSNYQFFLPPGSWKLSVEVVDNLLAIKRAEYPSIIEVDLFDDNTCLILETAKSLEAEFAFSKDFDKALTSIQLTSLLPATDCTDHELKEAQGKLLTLIESVQSSSAREFALPRIIESLKTWFGTGGGVVDTSLLVRALKVLESIESVIASEVKTDPAYLRKNIESRFVVLLIDSLDYIGRFPDVFSTCDIVKLFVKLLKSFLKFLNLLIIVDEKSQNSSAASFVAQLERTSNSTSAMRDNQFAGPFTYFVTSGAISAASKNSTNCEGAPIVGPAVDIVAVSINSTIIKACFDGTVGSSDESSKQKDSRQTVIGDTLEVDITVNCNGTNSTVPIRVGSNETAISWNTTTKSPPSLSTIDCGRVTGSIQCGFWNETVKQWSTDGCLTMQLEGGVYECQCNHLTDFAVFYEERFFRENCSDFKTLQIAGIVFAVLYACVASLGATRYSLFDKKESIKRFAHVVVSSLAVLRVLWALFAAVNPRSNGLAIVRAVFSLIIQVFLYGLLTFITFTWRDIVTFNMETAHLTLFQRIRIPMAVCFSIIFLSAVGLWIPMLAISVSDTATARRIFIAGAVVFGFGALAESACFAYFGYHFNLALIRQASAVASFSGASPKASVSTSHTRQRSAGLRVRRIGFSLSLLLVFSSGIWIASTLVTVLEKDPPSAVSWLIVQLVLELICLVTIMSIYVPSKQAEKMNTGKTGVKQTPTGSMEMSSATKIWSYFSPRAAEEKSLLPEISHIPSVTATQVTYQTSDGLALVSSAPQTPTSSRKPSARDSVKSSKLSNAMPFVKE